MQSDDQLSSNLTLDEVVRKMDKLIAPYSVVFRIMDEDTEEWQEAPGDMTLGDYDHYADNGIGTACLVRN